jgi:ABC-type sugar transport system ATPase subunit
MNLLEGTVHNVGNAIVVRLGDISVQPTPATASTLAPYLGTKIAVGLRPEDVVAVPSASPRFQARVVLREDVGSDVFLHVEPSGKIVESDAVREARESAADARRDLLIIRVSRTTEAREGELVGFGFEPDRLHFFDLETGLSIR